jgi:hypothetical protein
MSLIKRAQEYKQQIKNANWMSPVMQHSLIGGIGGGLMGAMGGHAMGDPGRWYMPGSGNQGTTAIAGGLAGAGLGATLGATGLGAKGWNRFRGMFGKPGLPEGYMSGMHTGIMSSGGF